LGVVRLPQGYPKGHLKATTKKIFYFLNIKKNYIIILFIF
jgi:hypothetical protein